MTAPKVSVIVPARNADPVVEEQIQCILSQKFESFELLICDDASQDQTYSILKQYAKHPKVRIFRNKTRMGSGATRNRLIKEALGQYCCPCDADDLLLPGALKRLSRFLDDDSKSGVVYADILMMHLDGKNRLSRWPRIVGNDSKIACDLFENAVNHGGSLMRRDLLLTAGGYPEISFADDWGLFLKLSEQTTISYLPGEVYYVWRVNSQSQSRQTKGTEKIIEDLIQETLLRRQRAKLNG